MGREEMNKQPGKEIMKTNTEWKEGDVANKEEVKWNDRKGKW